MHVCVGWCVKWNSLWRYTTLPSYNFTEWMISMKVTVRLWRHSNIVRIRPDLYIYIYRFLWMILSILSYVIILFYVTINYLFDPDEHHNKVITYDIMEGNLDLFVSFEGSIVKHLLTNLSKDFTDNSSAFFDNFVYF